MDMSGGGENDTDKKVGASVTYSCNSAFRRLRQEACEFTASLGYIARSYLSSMS
jgi:hypothetical protein